MTNHTKQHYLPPTSAKIRSGSKGVERKESYIVQAIARFITFSETTARIGFWVRRQGFLCELSLAYKESGIKIHPWCKGAERKEVIPSKRSAFYNF